MEQRSEQTSAEFRAKCLREAGLTYSLGALFPLVFSLVLTVAASLAQVGDTAPDWYLYLSYLFSQLSLFGAAAVYFVRTKEPVRAPFARPKWRYFPLAVLLQFGLLFSLSELNGYFIDLLSLIGYSSPGVPVPSLEGWGLLPAILVIALLPALFEELLFRGILARGMHGGGWGLVPSVLLAGAMFSLYHGNPEQTVYQFFCGACFTLIALRSGSILPTMVAHFLNNAVILIFTACGIPEFSALPTAWYLSLVILSAVCLLGGLVYLVFFDRDGSSRGGIKQGRAFWLLACAGLVVCGAEWISALVRGFLHG